MLLMALLGALAAVDSAAPAPACVAVAASVTSAPMAADLAAALTEHGGAVRWSADRSLAVWVQPRARDAKKWRGAVVDAVSAWNGIVPGLRLDVAGDSASADVRVVWASTLATAPNDPTAGALASLTAGRTTLLFDDAGHAAAATVVLAATAPDGTPYSPRDVRAVAQHELGHALGLAHHASPASVMAPLIVAETLDPADRATLRALYQLPVGAKCR